MLGALLVLAGVGLLVIALALALYELFSFLDTVGRPVLTADATLIIQWIKAPAWMTRGVPEQHMLRVRFLASATKYDIAVTEEQYLRLKPAAYMLVRYRVGRFSGKRRVIGLA